MKKLVEYEGELFVHEKYSGIPMLFILTDGIPMRSFTKPRKGQIAYTHLKIDDAIAWHRGEGNSDEGMWAERAEHLEKVKSDWEDYKTIYTLYANRVSRC